MKRTVIAILSAMVLLCNLPSASAQAQNLYDAEIYIPIEQMPDMVEWYGGPPSENSADFEYDKARYEWGKQMRNDKERAEAAIRQVDNTIPGLCAEFSKPFGMTLSKEETPQIYRLLRDAVTNCVKTAIEPKMRYNRLRPFRYYNEDSLTPFQQEHLHDNGSYPSGHTLRGWCVALLLLEVNPAAQNELLKMGYMMGDSRLICGVHWQSDVTASRLQASAAYARLHTDPRFCKQMKRAQREFARKSRAK
ncbi:MAG: phosphatase PAP2 family protein [Alistipes sp.]|nr:phosphatase PAP2 family protein [Alistipes sp.]